VQLLDGAPKLFVYGLGDDGLFAREFAMRLSLLGLLVVPHTDPILMLANLSAARPGDALLVFSEFGNLPQLSQLSRQFQDMGGKVISITRHTANRCARMLMRRWRCVRMTARRRSRSCCTVAPCTPCSISCSCCSATPIRTASSSSR
jgi:hypothetical protein